MDNKNAFEVIWLHGGQIGTIKASLETREEAETLFALVSAHYEQRADVELWEHNKLIRKQKPRIGV